MAHIEFNDGKRVKLSVETTDRLRKELIKDDGQLKVGCFRATYSPYSDGLRVVFMQSENAVWDGIWTDRTHFFYTSQIREIAYGLLNMIGDNYE